MSTTVDTFTRPINSIRLIDANAVVLKLKPFYYGDEVDMFFWKRLKINLGDFATTNTLIHKQSGFTYNYYRDRNKFVIIDNNNNIVLEKKVYKLSELCIDFDIYTSHQFIIHLDGSNGGWVYFYLPVLMRNFSQKCNSFNTSYLKGIGENYIPPTPIDPTAPTDPTSPDYYNPIGKLGDCLDIERFILEREFAKLELNKFEGINYHDITKEMVAEYPFYCDGFNFTQTQIQKIYQNATMFETLFILPLFSLSLFPALLPIDKEDETRNNRPVYEPFMIWGYFEFIRNKAVFDKIDRYAVDVFDLSPNWGG